MSHLAMLKNPSNILGYPDADNFEEVIHSSLSVDTSVVKFSHKDPFSSFYVKLLTDRQTDRETYDCRVLRNLRGKKSKIRALLRRAERGSCEASFIQKRRKATFDSEYNYIDQTLSCTSLNVSRARRCS